MKREDALGIGCNQISSPLEMLMMTSCRSEKQLGLEEVSREILADALFFLSDSRTLV
jgi:hypothetical protein